MVLLCHVACLLLLLSYLVPVASLNAKKTGPEREKSVYRRQLPDWRDFWSQVRVYIYPDSLNHASTKANSYWHTEKYIRNQLRRFATRNPTDANLFYMPVLTSGWGNDNDEKKMAEVHKYFASIYQNYPYWHDSLAKGCVDHFWISAHDRGGGRAAGARWFLNRSILLANSASSCECLRSCGSKSMYGWTHQYFDVRKDISTVPYPGMLSWYGQYPTFVSPKPERTLNVYFAGRYINRAHILHTIKQDARIQTDPSWLILHDGPGGGMNVTEQRNVKPRDPQYWLNLQSTKYALHIHGSQPFSSRLFEAIVAGAVPIIIAPCYVLPFDELLDWDQFSIRVDPSQVGNLYDVVSKLGESGYQKLSNSLAKVSHHFRYNSKPVPGDAFYMTMHSLHQRSQAANIPQQTSKDDTALL